MTSTGGSSVKAKRLAAGDEVSLKGRTWQVARAKRDKGGKRVHVELTAGADTFAGWVPEGRVFERPAPAALIDSSGAQTRWATEREAERTSSVMSADVHPGWDDGATPDLDPWVPSTEAEQAVKAIMGGTLLGAQRLDDQRGWYVPPVDGSTVMAHLLTFHATTPPSASIEDVRTPMAEQLDTAGEALMRADILGALTLHAQQHADGLPDGATPHRHVAA